MFTLLPSIDSVKKGHDLSYSPGGPINRIYAVSSKPVDFKTDTFLFVIFILMHQLAREGGMDGRRKEGVNLKVVKQLGVPVEMTLGPSLPSFASLHQWNINGIYYRDCK